MTTMRAQGHIPVRRQRKDGTDGAQGFSVVTSVTRNNFTESQWATYGTIGHTEYWNNTASIRNGARIGDLFTVVGTATDTGNGHTLTYRCDNASGDLHGVCISHEISNASIQGTIDNLVGSISCNSSGVSVGEQSVETNVGLEKGGTPQTIKSSGGVFCYIGSASYPLGSEYASVGEPTPATNYKVTITGLGTTKAKVKVYVKSGTTLNTPTIISIDVKSTINDVDYTRTVCLVICGNKKGDDGDGFVRETNYFGISEYGTSTNDSTAPSDINSWSSSQIAPTDSKPYIWKKVVTVYTNTTTTKYFCIGKKGDKGTGQKGESIYSLIVSTNCVKFTKDYANVVSSSPSSITLSLQYEGGSISLPSKYHLFYRRDGGSTWNTTSLGSLSVMTLFDSGVYSTIEFVMTTASSSSSISNDNIVSRVSISSVWEINRMLVPAGVYEDKEYTRTGTATPLVYKKVTGVSSEYWYLDRDTNKYWDSSSSSYKYAEPEDGSLYWKQATEYEVILTKMLFAEFARLGSFVVYDRFFISQYGTLVYKDSTGTRKEQIVKSSNVNLQYNGITPIVLNGNECNDIIVCKVSFYAAANTQIKITLTASSEANYDFGAIGVLGKESSPGNSKWLESATEESIKNTSVGTYMLKKASGTESVNTTITIPSAGEYFIEIAYARDVDSANNDNATFVFEKVSGTVTWRSLTKIKSGQYMTYSGYCQSAVPYAWFDPDDPMAETVPATGYKFRPTKCINALTGEEWMASGKVHVNQDGDVVMQDITINDATIQGSLMYHKMFVDKSYDYIRPFLMKKSNGAGVDIDDSGPVSKITMMYDTIIINGSPRTSAYNLFTGIVCTGYTILLPPARFFPGMRIKIINGTFSGGNGNAATLNPSPINLAVIYRNDTEEYRDNIDVSYTANLITAAIPVKFKYNGNSFTFVGTPDSLKCTDLTPSTAENFTVFGLLGDSTTVYKSIELVSQKNPFVSTFNTTNNGQDTSDYAWMITDVKV